MGSDFLELMRHVYFHAFHTKIKSVGRTFAEVGDAGVCHGSVVGGGAAVKGPSRARSLRV